MRIPTRCALPLLGLLALGCAKPPFVYEVEPAFRSASYATVAPDPRTDRIVIREGLRPLNPDLHLRAVLGELEARRYQRAAPDAADLWVAVYVLMPGATEGSAQGPRREGSGGEGRHGGGHGGGRGGSGTGGAPSFGKEGKGRPLTLIVQLEDRKTGLPVWQGEAHADSRERTPDGRPLGIEDLAHQLLQPLKPRP
ncbi:hypothetical protein GETHLI_08790 [Geothrix limicola]|uniref:DUF4136 domain-containing protein n=1 Tax=Geothrix limicola TaxID=2927978 RepID=A0ABQ5QCK4_9BACT|nr:DUF4136 domain-containing protein [Geothrix limicola]GLH72377.1 hypothetical protein GETHLI_08790 [Geothrix limicola]